MKRASDIVIELLAALLLTAAVFHKKKCNQWLDIASGMKGVMPMGM